MAKNLSREYKIGHEGNIEVSIGTTDRINPIVIYINFKTWLFVDDNGNYSEELSNLSRRIRYLTKKTLINNSLFESKYILDFDMNGETFTKRKIKYLDVGIYLKQKSEQPLSIVSLKDMLKDNLLDMSQEIETSLIDNGFKVNRSKKWNLQK